MRHRVPAKSGAQPRRVQRREHWHIPAIQQAETLGKTAITRFDQRYAASRSKHLPDFFKTRQGCAAPPRQPQQFNDTPFKRSGNLIRKIRRNDNPLLCRLGECPTLYRGFYHIPAYAQP